MKIKYHIFEVVLCLILIIVFIPAIICLIVTLGFEKLLDFADKKDREWRNLK